MATYMQAADSSGSSTLPSASGGTAAAATAGATQQQHEHEHEQAEVWSIIQEAARQWIARIGARLGASARPQESWLGLMSMW
jgi:hypothetical protein